MTPLDKCLMMCLSIWEFLSQICVLFLGTSKCAVLKMFSLKVSVVDPFFRISRKQSVYHWFWVELLFLSLNSMIFYFFTQTSCSTHIQTRTKRWVSFMFHFPSSVSHWVWHLLHLNDHILVRFRQEQLGQIPSLNCHPTDGKQLCYHMVVVFLK